MHPDQVNKGNQTGSEWRDGWPLLLASFLGAALATIPMNLVGVFMRPLAAEFGWSHGAMSVAVPLSAGSIALSAPFAGKLIDKYGARRFGLAGCVALPVTICCLSLYTSSITSYWLAWTLMAAAQVTSSILIWSIPVAAHFRRNRGAALAVVLMGTSFTGVCYAPVATLMIEHWGWRMAYLGTGVAALALVLPVVWKFFHAPDKSRGIGGEPAQPGLPPEVASLSLSQALRTRQFRQFALAILLAAGSSIGLFVQIVPISVSLGLQPLQAATVASLIGAGSVTAKLIVGPLIDRVRAAPLAAVTMLGPITACMVLLSTKPLDPAWALTSGFLIGLATGAELDVIGVIVARYFGTAHYGQIYGFALGVFQISLATGPLLLGLAFDWQGDYRIALESCVALLAASGILFMTMGPERASGHGHSA